MTAPISAPRPVPTSALYRTAWRWHLYAGLLTAPFALFLAVTGALYLWKPQYEDWRYHALLHAPSGTKSVAPWDQQLAAARRSHPDDALISFAPPSGPGRTTEVVLAGSGEDTLSVFVDPGSGRVIGERRESERLMTKLHDLHGTLFAGRAGQWVVELAASWMCVLLLTGFYLWWPRPTFSVWGFLLPRLRSGRSLFWRDLHAVPAVWVSCALAAFLTTGMLWTQGGGAWYRWVSAALGQGSPPGASAHAHASALMGWPPPLKAGPTQALQHLASAAPTEPAHAGHPHGHGALKLAPGALALDRVVAIAQARRVPPGYAILFPDTPTGVFTVVSDRNRPFQRVFLYLDQYSGAVLGDVRFRDFGVMGQFGQWAIIAHEGQLFGLANQLLGTLAALGVGLIAVSGVNLWWIRRPASAPAVRAPLPAVVRLGLGLLCLGLPLLAGSLALLWAADAAFGRRWGRLTPARS